MDPDVVEIPPPINHRSRYKKQKQVIMHDVIDIDNDDDSEDLVIIGEKISNRNKGKTIEAIHEGYGDHQVVQGSDYSFYQPGMENFGPVSGIDSSNGHPSVSHNLISVDGHDSNLSYGDNDYDDILSEDYIDIDEYALLQAHFDNVDIPTGIEAPFTLLPFHDLGLMNTGNSTFYPWFDTQSYAKNSHVTDSSLPSRSLDPSNSKIQRSTMGSSSLQINMNNVDHSSGTMLSSPQSFSQAAPSKKKSAASQRSGHDLNHSSGVESSKSHRFIKSVHNKMKSAIFGSKKHGLVENPEAMKLPHAGKPPYLGQFKSAKKVAGSSSSYHSNFIGQDGSLHPPGIESVNPWWKSSHNSKPLFTNNTANPIHYPLGPFDAPPPEHVFDSTQVHKSARNEHNGTAVDPPVLTITDKAKDKILTKFRSFKKFDTVDDTSDHHFAHNNSSVKQNPKNWAKKIQDEWKILEKDLPDSIFVRVYESRMDLLRAMIIGAEGTPYHDGLFFFDVYFPSGYPNVPPLVHYHSGGLRLNPNLYNCGKVCLSLLNTWSGNGNEKWLPGVSTILQVLVSIQGLILNTKPYFNEPGYEYIRGSKNGEEKSLRYNEDTFILSLRTMMYMIKRPPKHFKDFVVGHFCSRAHDILMACKAYMEGAQVGCMVKGGVQNVDEGVGSCSISFKGSLAGCVNQLVKEFARIGAEDCEKFLSPPPKLIKGGSL